MTGKTYLRPTGLVDAPFGHDGKVARLAGGLQFFASVEIVRDEGTELVQVAGIEDRLDESRSGSASGWCGWTSRRWWVSST